MKYKTIETTVPDWAKWLTIDANGDLWCFDLKPEYSGQYKHWGTCGDEAVCVGLGPPPDDASKELYRLEWVWE